MTPVFEIVKLIGSLFYTTTPSNWPPLSAEKISLSLSHLVPEILGPKVGLIVHQNVLFNGFSTFCINFLLDFQSNWPPFSLILDLFDPSFSQNLISDSVQFCSHAEPTYRKFSEVPPHPPSPPEEKYPLRDPQLHNIHHNWLSKSQKCTQRWVQPDQCYFTVQITGINFECRL